MRLHRRSYFARGLSVATVAAVLALFATADAEAQRRGGFSMGGSKANFGAQRPMQMRSTMPRTTSKMVKGKYGSKLGSKAATNLGTDGGRVPPKDPKGPVVGEKPPGPGPGRPPRWPGRPASA